MGNRVLIVLAHPVPGSFAHVVAEAARTGFASRGWEIDIVDLYADGFEPCLTAAERVSYFTGSYDRLDMNGSIERLEAADALVLVFPQWWFNMPAIMKGFIDRVFVPGAAFDNAADGGRIKPLLSRLKTVLVFSTTGAPWWFVKFYMGDPVRKIIGRGIVKFCSRTARFEMHCLHDMDRSSKTRREKFLAKVRAVSAKV